MKPSAEIVRVESAKCRRECDLSGARAALCGDHACRGREMQAARTPLRRSCVSSARKAGESAICPMRAQPSAEIMRVECAKCRRECDLPGVRATLCASRARNAGESAICPVRARPSAEIVRVECATCRRECVLETCRFTFGGSLVRNARFGDLTLHFWRKSRTKRSFWGLSASLLEEVSYETVVLETLDSDLASS